jgi:DHA1 family bicyclomycin/chloramphenicol resistance-like MFS transporter
MLGKSFCKKGNPLSEKILIVAPHIMNQQETVLKGGIKEFEFVALMAFLMSNVALSIDAILPALPNIGEALQVADANNLQLIIIMIFLGLGLGEVVFGTLSDSFGRKPIVYTGVGVFILASLLIIWAPSLEVMLVGRVIQGMGLSAARSVSIAIIRDTYKGDRMARIMSFIMTIFILVPMIAPIWGKFVLEAFNWQAIFSFQLIFIGLVVIWFGLRQRETLSKDKRIMISKQMFANGIREFFRQKNTVRYTLMSGLVQGTFIVYLGSSQQIFQGQYGLVDEFPYIFGGLAFAIGFSSLMNGFLVVRFGMIKLVQTSLLLTLLSSLTYIFLFLNSPNPSVAVLIGFLFFQFLTLGFIFGNLSALAMQPLGHIAGIGAAIYNFIAMFLAVITAVIIGNFIQDTVLPLFAGFVLSSVIGLVLMLLSKGKRGGEN